MHDISANNMGHIGISTLIGDHYCKLKLCYFCNSYNV